MEAMQTRYGQNIKRYYTGYEIHLGHRKLMLYADLGLAYFHSKENSVVNIISNLTLKMRLFFHVLYGYARKWRVILLGTSCN